jgi:Reverse transcriptase (RNA-dependent DNA polymerase)
VGAKFIILVLYVDDILLASSDLNILFETNYFLSKKFDMKNFSETSYIIGIEIQRNRSRGILDLSQKVYIKKNTYQCYNMQSFSPSIAHIVKDDKNTFQCPKNNLERA